MTQQVSSSNTHLIYYLFRFWPILLFTCLSDIFIQIAQTFKGHFRDVLGMFLKHKILWMPLGDSCKGLCCLNIVRLTTNIFLC